MKLGKARKVILYLSATYCFFLVAGAVLLSVLDWLALLCLGLAAALMVTSLILTLLLLRCPHCRGTLWGRYSKWPAFCPHCGEALDWQV